MNAVRVATALLVDDDVSSRQANQERLEDDGYTVVVARDQAEGLDRAKQSAPNVIFIHLVSEGVGSLPFIEALRADVLFEKLGLDACIDAEQHFELDADILDVAEQLAGGGVRRFGR